MATIPMSLQGTGMLLGDIARRDQEISAYMQNQRAGGSSAGGGIQRIGASGNSTTSSSGQPLNTGLSTENNAALETLIAQLTGGGTANMQADRAARNVEAGTLRDQRAGYSKEAAFSDSKALMDASLRQALEKLMPTINSAALGAGTSQSSMRALLTQKAAQSAADASAAQGMTASVNYGNIANGTSAILERLLSQGDPAIAGLVQALQVAKNPAPVGGDGSGAGGGRFSGGGMVMPGFLPSTQYAPQAPLNFGGGGIPFGMTQRGGETTQQQLDRESLGNVGTTPGSRLSSFQF